MKYHVHLFGIVFSFLSESRALVHSPFLPSSFFYHLFFFAKFSFFIYCKTRFGCYCCSCHFIKTILPLFNWQNRYQSPTKLFGHIAVNRKLTFAQLHLSIYLYSVCIPIVNGKHKKKFFQWHLYF